MTIPTITPLPIAPQVTDTPSVFSQRANTFVAALEQLVTETNVSIDEINTAIAGNLVKFDGFKGVWEPGSFGVGDLVFYHPDEEFYISLEDSNTQEPPQAPWQLVSVDLDEAFNKVLKPSGLSPAGQLPIGPDSETPTLKSSFYYHLRDFSHAFSQFQVSTSISNFDANIIYDSGQIPATLSHTVPAGNLTEETTFYFRVKYIDENGIESEFSDPFEFKTQLFFDYTDPANIGVAVNGGFLAGVIDTVAGTIQGDDDYQTGLRYAVIVAPKSLEQAAPIEWDTTRGSGEAGCFTRWNGLEATEVILAKNNDSRYEAFGHIRSVRTSDPVPSDGGSDWYLPAMDELELLYRNLKPNTTSNLTETQTENFPGAQTSGVNPSSDPVGNAYTSGNPDRTTVTAFQQSNSESMDMGAYWTSTDADGGGFAWREGFVDFPGRQVFTDKSRNDISARPVRRILL